MKAVVTGSCGLIGSAVSRRLMSEGWHVTGIDNNSRERFFGKEGSTVENEMSLRGASQYDHHTLDIRSPLAAGTIQMVKPNLIVHAAAQPSHDWAGEHPIEDFEINVMATMNLLEAARLYCPESPFIFFSTNKVYGDALNAEPRYEFGHRYNFTYMKGVNENYPIDRTMHSPYGAGKLAADIYVQEYGRYYWMPTVCLRCSCLVGEDQSGVELHGFLSYLMRCAMDGRPYNIYGYEGKQVRDNLHADDVADFIMEFAKNPKCGEVYNLGGGYSNSISILEAIHEISYLTGKKIVYELRPPRLGDHVVYYTDLGKTRRDYPNWNVTIDMSNILKRLAKRWQR